MSTALATQTALAVLLGGTLAAGLCVMLAALPRWNAPRLQRRIAGYIRDIADPAGLTPLPGPSRPVGERLRLWAARVSSSQTMRQHLRQAGRPADVDALTAQRARQLAWAVAGLILGGVGTVALVLAGRFTPAATLLPFVAAAAAGACHTTLLTHAARARMHRVQQELPTVLEFLSLCLSAGEGVLDAVRRVAAAGAGELTAELRAVVLIVGTGTPLAEALTSMASELQLPALTRSVDHIVAALDRGAPLAGVLQAQAQDAREDAKRQLLEAAGRKEILMLLPLVFLILPLSVLFAVFPGVFMLRLGLG